MSKNNLNAFFDAQKKKKPANTKNASGNQQKQESQEPTQQEEKKLETQNKQKLVDDYESSDEEKTDIQTQSNIQVMDKATLDAQKRRKQQQEEEDSGASGWQKLDRHANQQQSAQPAQLAGQASGPKASGGDIKFSKGGPPKFNKRTNKTKVLDEEFPEMDSGSQPSQKEQPADQQQLSKKDNANIDFGRATAQSRPAQEETKKPEATKPMFTNSKKKALGGGDNADAIQQSKQNYDFSVFQSSNFTQKKERQEGDNDEERKRESAGQGKRPRPFGQQEPLKAPAFEDDADFEVVKDKRAERKKKESAF